MPVNRVTWKKAGLVNEPGRYMYTFGWLTITAADLEVWREFPNASFALVPRPATEESLGEEEFRLGSFDVSPET